MPKRHDRGRHAPPRPDEPAGPPPEQAEVERAIETIVERLKPKPRKPAAPVRKPGRGTGEPGQLSLVWNRDGEGA